jgi:hypothetical protein
MSMKMIFSRYANMFLLLAFVSSATADDAMLENVPVVSSGLWPFKNYVVTFPNLVFQDNLNRVFSIDAIKTNNTLHIALFLTADTKVQFVNFDPIMEFAVTTKDGEIFRSNRRVFSHYFHMRREGRSLWPSSDEWLCAFEWGSENSNRAIPFSESLPAVSKQIKCDLMIENPRESIKVSVKCLNCNADIPINAAIEVTSSWK